MRQIDQEFVESGRTRVVWQHVAFLGDESRWAAETAECAGEQGRFWDYHYMVFEEVRGWNGGKVARPNLQQYAAALGLDSEAFRSCLASEWYAPRVQAEVAAAREQGVSRGPMLDVNGQRFEGVPILGAPRAAILGRQGQRGLRHRRAWDVRKAGARAGPTFRVARGSPVPRRARPRAGSVRVWSVTP